MFYNNSCLADTRILNFQASIEDAYAKSLVAKNPAPLIADLKLLNNNPVSNRYWISYNYLHQALFYINNKDNNTAKKMIKTGLLTIQDSKIKNSEEFALLAYLQCMYIKFTSGLESGVYVQKSIFNANKSIELDPNNIRGWYILGLLDYYTPRKIGGGKKCEEFFKKAISVKVNQKLPTWGRKDAYLLLITYYSDNKQFEQIRIVKTKARLEFPNEEIFK